MPDDEAVDDAAVLIEQARRWVSAPAGEDKIGRDPVNRPMINNWVGALGDANPVYVDEEAAATTRHGGLIAPPGMLQTWTMDAPREDEDGPWPRVLEALDAAGYTSVVATNYEHDYLRELRPGDHIRQRTTVEDIGEEKRTALGVGRFVTVKHTYLDQHDEVVGIGRMRLLKFRPPAPSGAPPGSDGDAATRPARPRPAINRDNAYFWEGVEAGELRIQRCGGCGVLRHPPRPMCDRCGSTQVGHVVASGRGLVHSFVVHHHPPLPGVDTPHPVLLVDLEEGVRILAEAAEGTDPQDVAVGREVRAEFKRVDEELTVPAFRLVGVGEELR